MLQIFNLSDFELLEYTSIGQLDFFMKIHYKRVLVNIQIISNTKKIQLFFLQIQMSIDHRRLMIFQGITGTSKQSFHLENMDVIITGKSSEHHLEVLNVAVLPKVFKSFESSHFKPLMYDDGGLSKPVKYPYIANINA